MNGFEINRSEICGDSNTNTSDIDEVETGLEVSDNEMDSELSQELDDSYDSYIRDGKWKGFESNFTQEKEAGKTELHNTDIPRRKEVESSISDIGSKPDNGYNDDVNEDENIESRNKKLINDAENTPEVIKCRNEDLEGQEHPETGVPFERKKVEVDGKQYEVVVPVFESTYDARLTKDMYDASDHEQFKECNSQLKNEIATNIDLRAKFDEEQLEQIENGDTPDGYTWHHDAEAGKMQLVDTEIHQKTGHTGGRSIWGGGTENR